MRVTRKRRAQIRSMDYFDILSSHPLMAPDEGIIQRAADMTEVTLDRQKTGSMSLHSALRNIREPEKKLEFLRELTILWELQERLTERELRRRRLESIQDTVTEQELVTA